MNRIGRLIHIGEAFMGIKVPYRWLILIVILVLIASLRFNRNSFLVNRPLNDAMFYIANVEYFRGETLTYPFKDPFNERLLVTAVAALLPFEAMTSINLVNIACVIAGLWFLYRLLQAAGLSSSLTWLGMGIFVFSFPTFYYTAIGYTDPGVLMSIFMGAYALYDDKPLIFLTAILLGAFAKENIVILLPVAAAFGYTTGKRKWFIISLLGVCFYVAITSMLKSYWIRELGYGSAFFWQPEWFRIKFNLTRPLFYISVLLSMGIPFLLLGVLFFLNKKAVIRDFVKDLPLWTALGVVFFCKFFMVISAFPDGRLWWVNYCFPILLAMTWWQRYGNPFLPPVVTETTPFKG